ncbi:hypothetical protein GCM10023158_08740 [Gluconacetobacter tumulicola]
MPATGKTIRVGRADATRRSCDEDCGKVSHDADLALKGRAIIMMAIIIDRKYDDDHKNVNGIEESIGEIAHARERGRRDAAPWWARFR